MTKKTIYLNKKPKFNNNKNIVISIDNSKNIVSHEGSNIILNFNQDDEEIKFDDNENIATPKLKCKVPSTSKNNKNSNFKKSLLNKKRKNK